MKPSYSPSSYCALLLAVLGITTGFEPSLTAGQAPASDLRPQVTAATVDQVTLTLKVVSGANGVNIVKRKTAVAPLIEVRDRNNGPIAGAIVNFSSPNLGPSVTFINGRRDFSAITETNGRASAPVTLPIAVGVFQITVTATYDGSTATATIQQTNYATIADAERAGIDVPARSAAGSPSDNRLSKGGGLSTGALLGIVAGIAGAAAIGIVLGTRHSGGSSSSTTIGVGTPTVGAPH